MRGILLLFTLLFCAVSLNAQTHSNRVGDSIVQLNFYAYEMLFAKDSSFSANAILGSTNQLLKDLNETEKNISDSQLESEEPKESSLFLENKIFDASFWQFNSREDKEVAIPLNDIRFQSIALNTMPGQNSGFNVLPNGKLISRAIFAGNAVRQEKVQFFIDGIPIEYFGGLYSVNSTPLSSIDKFELHNKVKPISLLTDRVGGAINFKTMLEGDDNLDFSYSYGLYNTHQVSTSGYSRDKESGLTFRGTGFFNYSDNNYKVWEGDTYLEESDVLEKNEEELEVYRFNDAYYNIGGKMDFGFTDVSWADQVFLSMWFGHKYDEVQHGATMDIPFGNRYYRQENMMPSLTYQRKNFIWKDLDISFYAAYSSEHTDVNDVSNFRFNWLGEKFEDSTVGEQSAELSYFDDNAFINRVVLDYRINKKHSLTLSSDFSHLVRTSDNLKENPIDMTSEERQDLEKDIVALGYTNTSEDKGLETTFFGKYYGFNVTNFEEEFDFKTETRTTNKFARRNNNFGYGVLLKYEFNRQLFFQSSFERAVSMPNVDQLFGNESVNILTTYNRNLNAVLKPEESKNTYLSIFYKNDAKKDHLIHVGAHISFRNVKNYIQANVTRENGFDYYYFENHEKVQSKEIEFQIDYSYRNMLDVSLTASYLNAHNNSVYDTDGEENKYFNSRLKNEPYFNANAGVNFRTFYDVFMQETQFTFSWNTRFTQEYLYEWEEIGNEETEMIPSQFVNNIGVMYGFPNNKLFLSAEARNIFDVPVYDNYKNQLAGRGIYFKVMFNL